VAPSHKAAPGAEFILRTQSNAMNQMQREKFQAVLWQNTI